VSKSLPQPEDDCSIFEGVAGDWRVCTFEWFLDSDEAYGIAQLQGWWEPSRDAFVLYFFGLEEDADIPHRAGLGRRLLQQFKTEWYSEILVVAVTPNTRGFWEKMRLEGIVQAWWALGTEPLDLRIPMLEIYR